MSPHVPLNIAVVGATGMVGREFLEILEERKFAVGTLKLFSSPETSGQTIGFRGKQYRVENLREGCFDGIKVAFFCAPGAVSKQWAPAALKAGSFVIDKSSTFRTDEKIPLVVPEVNGELIPTAEKPVIIANPNCSTIQLVVTLNPIQKKLGLQSVQVATYQSVSGAGSKGVDELSLQTRNLLNAHESAPEVFPHAIAFNNIPHIDSFGDDGFTGEETKIMQETRRILELPELDITATCVRTPTFNGHSEAVWVTVKEAVDKSEFVKLLTQAPGIEVVDNPTNNEYPLNRNATKQDPVFVGRIRQDPMNPKRWLLWIVADNIRKGAALNGLQIAERIFNLD